MRLRLLLLRSEHGATECPVDLLIFWNSESGSPEKRLNFEDSGFSFNRPNGLFRLTLSGIDEPTRAAREKSSRSGNRNDH